MNLNNLLNKNNTIVKYGKYNVTDHIDALAIKTESITTIDPYTFYSIYLQLESVIGIKDIDGEHIDISLTPHPLELLAHFMIKPQEYYIHYKKGSQLLQDLGVELNRTPASIYKSITILKTKKYLIKSEDSILVLNNQLQNLKRKINNQISTNGHISYDYIFKFNIK